MSEKENEINEFMEYYKDQSIPSPEHEPLRFAAWVRNFRYYKTIEKQNESN